ncbi:universal stress protein [Prauserella oleivorans]|uniref:Universal stress protein n=1 Tax=Prauserella oleivorans TaxID=1478153 RepID=A0ABW5WAU0_9PSEU
MSEEEFRNGPVVVGVDGSPSATEAVCWAAALAARRNLPLRIVHGFSYTHGFYGGDLPVSTEVYAALEEDGRRLLSAAGERARGLEPGLTVETDMPTQPAIPLLVHESQYASVVVLGTSGRGGFAGMLVGSTAVSVVAHARCPVVVVRGRADGGAVPVEGPVVVGVDGSGVSRDAVGVAFREASLREVPLVAVHAGLDVEYDPAPAAAEPDEQRILSEGLAGRQEQYPDVHVERVVVADRPRHQLLEWSARAQLVVVGSRGRGGFRGMLLGSTSQALIHHAQCPVMVVRYRERAD